MRQAKLIILSNEEIAAGVFRLRLRGGCDDFTAPGQFLNLALPGVFLRRPFSICDLDPAAGVVTIIYKVVGEGTRTLSRLREGTLDALSGLGNGFDTAPSGSRPLLVGGGVGAPPLYLLARALLDEGKTPAVALGFRGAEDVILADEFRALGVRTFIFTEQESGFARGLVTSAPPFAQKNYSYVYACGPLPMLRAVYEASASSGQFSFEARMGCGFGACMGCTVMTTGGPRRLCREGPVLRKEEIVWE